MHLKKNEYLPFFDLYVQKANELNKDLLTTLTDSFEEVTTFFSSIPKEKHLFAYQDKKWTIKEILGHIIDTERILMNRALKISRNDFSPLVHFNENNYVANSNANEIPFEDLMQEYKLVRKSIIMMFKNFNEEILIRNNGEFSVRAFAYIISGHALHHVNVIKERYL